MSSSEQKHPCPDCRQCQWCSEDRCRLCLRSASGCRRKLSMAEQIALYEQLNAAGKGQECAPAGAVAGETGNPCPFDLENSVNSLK